MGDVKRACAVAVALPLLPFILCPVGVPRRVPLPVQRAVNYDVTVLVLFADAARAMGKREEERLRSGPLLSLSSLRFAFPLRSALSSTQRRQL